MQTTHHQHYHGYYLHEIHVVQGHVVELYVLYDGGGAGVVGSIDQGENLTFGTIII